MGRHRARSTVLLALPAAGRWRVTALLGAGLASLGLMLVMCGPWTGSADPGGERAAGRRGGVAHGSH
ncbi:hypothetical protein ACSNOD_29945, partial [Streptomyces sp. URMC 123]